jgi:Trk K+ transport system NAD-binding subunit
LAGRTVQDVTIPGESVVSAIVRRGQAMIPTADTRLEAEDELHVAIAVTAIPKLDKLLAH